MVNGLILYPCVSNPCLVASTFVHYAINRANAYESYNHNQRNSKMVHKALSWSSWPRKGVIFWVVAESIIIEKLSASQSQMLRWTDPSSWFGCAMKAKWTRLLSKYIDPSQTYLLRLAIIVVSQTFCQYSKLLSHVLQLGFFGGDFHKCIHGAENCFYLVEWQVKIAFKQ